VREHEAVAITSVAVTRNAEDAGCTHPNLSKITAMAQSCVRVMKPSGWIDRLTELRHGHTQAQRRRSRNSRGRKVATTVAALLVGGGLALMVLDETSAEVALPETALPETETQRPGSLRPTEAHGAAQRQRQPVPFAAQLAVDR
jgi:hypothetical protein